ncbi:MAG: hypothetical protein ACYDB1_10475 [Acidiferrobacteraceae bacterium]
MFVANNYDNLDGWETYRDDLSLPDGSTSYMRLTEYIVPASGVPLDECWLTNYCLGVMARENSQYRFPALTRNALDLEAKFNEFVAIMKPRLIVAMGGLAKECLRASREPATRGGTRIMAIDHPGRWHKGRDYFVAEGERIRRALAMN